VYYVKVVLLGGMSPEGPDVATATHSIGSSTMGFAATEHLISIYRRVATVFETEGAAFALAYTASSSKVS
jgi:hypothetical protein